MARSLPAITHHRLNNVLSIAVACLGIYIMLSPFIPAILFSLRDTSPEKLAPYGGQLAAAIGVDDSESSNTIPKDNRIVIPSIGLDESIKQGSNIWVIHDGGTWLRPQTPRPNEPGNSVIVGHRYYGNSVSTFYHLDKVSVGDDFAVYWEGSEIVYTVTETKVVDATEVSIEAATADRQLTLYTCHPLWTAKQRLVIIAKPK